MPVLRSSQYFWSTCWLPAVARSMLWPKSFWFRFMPSANLRLPSTSIVGVRIVCWITTSLAPGIRRNLAAIAQDVFGPTGQHLRNVLRDKGGDTPGGLDAHAERRPHMHLHDPRPDLGEELAAVEVKQDEGADRDRQRDGNETDAMGDHL